MTALSLYIAGTFIAWALCFLLIQKPMFGLVNRRAAESPLTMRELGRIYSHGLPTDLIVTSYATGATLLLSVTCAIAGINPMWVVTPLNIALAIIVGLMTVSDTILYGYWHYKLDSSVLPYLRNLKGATASVSNAYIAGALLLWMLTSCVILTLVEAPLLVYCGYGYYMPATTGAHFLPLTLLLAGGAVCFVLIRGLHRRPYNPSIAYYSKDQFCNHFAVNPIYTFIYSISVKNDFGSQHRYMPKSEADTIVNGMFPAQGEPEKLLKTDRPNVLLIVWESFNAQFFGPTGGDPTVTPNLERLSRDGIVFTNCVAGSWRTDRALVNIISGFPAPTNCSIIRYNSKLPHLPAIARSLRDKGGYNTTAVHGGDLMIMHKADYYLASGHDSLVAQRDFPKDAPTGKWGIHDGYVMDWLAGDIKARNARGERWMITLQTLSSHETFEVPYNRLADPAANSFAYVDHSLGSLVDDLKQSPGWDNTLIVIVGDHGLAIGSKPLPRHEFCHLPMVWLGGAIRQPMTIDRLVGQTDIAATLLGQLGIDHSDFRFSRDIFARPYEPWAYHSFTNGMLFFDTDGHTEFDMVSGQVVDGKPERINRAKALAQTYYDHLDKI